MSSPIATRVETLEGRIMLAVTPVQFRDGRLLIRGTEQTDSITITQNSADTSLLNVDVVGKPTKSYPLAKIKRLVIDGRGGNDIIDIQKTLVVNSLIRGGYGDDSIFCGAGKNAVFGEKGDDSIIGNESTDLIDGGMGNDILRGEGGNDLIHGGAGNDEIDGGADDDLLLGGAGLDTIVGGEGDDRISGNSGVDLFSAADEDEVRDFKETRTFTDKSGKKVTIRGDVWD